MNLRKRLVPVVLAVVLLLAGGAPAPAALGAFDSIVIFATNSVRLSSDVEVSSGDIVVNQASAGPTLGNGFELYVDKKATVANNAKADSIQVLAQAKILGTVFFNDLSNSGSVGGQVTPLSLPVVSPLPPFVTGQPRGSDVFVPPAGSIQLAPGGFKNITAGDGATIVFSGGVYDIQSIDVQNDVTLAFNAPSEIRISGKFRTRRRAVIGPAPACQQAGVPCSASAVVFYVAGINGADGALASTPEAARIGSDSAVAANYYAPNGTLRLEVNTLASGAFLGRDVMLDRGARVSLASAFVNKPPIADPQTVEGVSGVTTIVLTGSDPEGSALGFSIPVPPSSGTLGAISPIQDPGQCSATVQACTGVGQCPGSETCVLPPITRASVQYTPANCTSGGCPADSFTFGVTDDCGALGTAVVQINPNDPSGPPPPLNAVVADDLLVDMAVGSVSNITLTAGAPPSVASLTFAVHTVPLTGALRDEFGNPITVANVPYSLPSPIVAYTAPGSPGTASFVFSARDATTSLPCLAPHCDTGDVNITFGERAPLAQPLSVETSLNQPVQITLQANPGGVGTGGAGLQTQQSVSNPGYTYYYEAQPIGSGSGNGSSPAAVRSEPPGKGKSKTKGIGAAAQAIPSGSIPLAFNAGWSANVAVPPAFYWTGTVPVFACDDSEPSCQGVFTFTGAGCLSVTDDFQKGDQFRIYDNGVVIGTTTTVAVDAGSGEVGPDAAYLDPTYSSGSFPITGTGSHAIAIEVVGNSFAAGRGYIRVDSGGCQPNLEVTSFSAPSSAALDQAIGSQILATVTNTGLAVIPAGTSASIGYYISSDSTITTADRLLQGGRENLSQQAPGGLAVGQSVQINLFSGAAIGSQIPNAEPPTGNVFIGVLVDEFNEVAESDEDDNTASQPINVTASAAPQLSYRIETLPPASAGTLRTLSGAAITVGQTFAVTAPTLVFTPTLAFTGSTSFNYSVTEGLVSSVASVGILVSDLLDTCTPVGRPAGCAPGGTTGFQSEGPSQQALEREVAAGPSRGLTITVEGSGSVATSSVTLSGNRVLRGLICHGATCNKVLPEGAEIVLYARPEGDASEFVRWEGACWGDEPITSVRLSDHTLCTAVFGDVR